MNFFLVGIKGVTLICIGSKSQGNLPLVLHLRYNRLFFNNIRSVSKACSLSNLMFAHSIVVNRVGIGPELIKHFIGVVGLR